MTRRTVIHSLVTVLLATYGAGCALGPRPAGQSGTSNLTAGMVKAEVVKGVTTQADILRLFGAPNIVTKNRDEDEVWNYNRMAFESTQSQAGVLAVLWGGNAAGGGGASRAVSTATTRSFDLILIFDENDVVRDYSVIAATY